MTGKEQEFIDYLRAFSERLQKEQRAGIPNLLKSLPADHAAITFAKEINPAFDSKHGK